jgi:hypothetical protein
VNVQVKEENGVKLALVADAEWMIFDVPSALDFMVTIQYETGCSRVAVRKEAFAEEFFILSSGLAGEILQKFVTYRFKLAVVGDYSKYTSKPLRDFIWESNRGKDIFFVSSEEEAVQKLRGA